MLQHMTSFQFTEWMEYEKLEPFGADHERNLTNWVCSTIANFSQMMCKGEKEGERKLWQPNEFIPDPKEDPKPIVQKKQTQEELMTALKAIGMNSKRREELKVKAQAAARRRADKRKVMKGRK